MIARSSPADGPARAALADNESTAVKILESITDGYHVVDAAGRFTEINATAREMFRAQGVDPDRLLGKRLFNEVLTEARETEAAAALERTLNERVPTSVEHFYEPWQQWHFVRHFPTADGGVATLFQDVTERKQLTAAHDTFRHLVVNAPFGVYVVDGHFRLVQVSAGAQKVFSQVRPLLGRDFEEVLRIIWPEPFASEAIAKFRHTLTTGEAYHAPRTIERRRDLGEVEAYDWKLERVMLPDGQFGVVCHFYDLSERQAVEARATFLSVLSQKLATMQDGQAIIRIATKEVGEFMNADRCHFLEVAPDLEHVTVLEGWRRGGPEIAGMYQFSAFGEADWKATVGQESMGISDVASHPGTRRLRANYLPLGVRAMALAPYLRDGRWTASVSVAMAECRDWKPEELQLLDDVVARVWPLVERARAEAQLRESEERFRSVFEQSATGIAQTDMEGRFVMVNERFCAITGWSREELLKRNLKDITHPADLAGNLPSFRALADGTGPNFVIEKRYVRPDGSFAWVRNDVVAIRAADGSVLNITATVSEITEQKRAEAALRESEERFRNMANNAPVMIWITEPDGYCSFLSESWYDFTGQTPETGLGFGWVHATHPLDEARAHGSFVNANAQRQPYRVEYRLRGKDGQYRWALDTATPRFSHEGVFLGYIGSVIDIEDRKQVEEALRRSEQRKTALVELADRMREVNDPADVAYAAAEILGKTLQVSRCGYGTIDTSAETITIERDWNAPGIRSLAGVLHFRDYGTYIEDLKRGEAVVFADAEKDPRTAATAEALKAISAQAVVNLPITEQGGFVALLYLNHEHAREWTEDELVFIRDVAERTRVAVERRRTEQALRASMEEAARVHRKAEAASRAKDDFLAALSHELRTPLNPVLMVAAELAADERLPEEVRKELRMIQRNIGLEARLIDDLLDLTRISRGMLTMHLETINAHALLRHTQEILSTDLAGRKLELRLEFDAREPFVRADSARLQQVFWNLWKNSIKFTPDGGRITIRTSNPERGRLRIAVEDTGRGIQPEALERIFRAFDQGDLSGRHAFGGLGLGLSISKALVDLHGGTLHAASRGQDQGATFRVEMATTIPEVPAEQAAPAVEDQRRLRLLVVEDDETSLAVLVQLLRRRGHDVHAASTVREALEVAANQKCDLVISDLGLPDGTGMDLMREIQRRYGWPGIALSGYGMEEDQRKSREAGFVAHLVKPVAAKELMRVMAEVVG